MAVGVRADWLWLLGYGMGDLERTADDAQRLPQLASMRQFAAVHQAVSRSADPRPHGRSA